MSDLQPLYVSVTSATLVGFILKTKRESINQEIGSFQGRCVICGGAGVSDAYYCVGCTRLEKDREGCPKIINLGSSKTDLFYERKKFGFKKR